MNLQGAKILVTGGTGFLGKHLVKTLLLRGAEVEAPSKLEVDLTNIVATSEFFERIGAPDYVFHLAGFNGGIQFNKLFPAKIYYENTVMGLNVLEMCKRLCVKKVVSVVASCAYPEEETESYERTCKKEVMEEYSFLNGPPHESVACHGYAKRNIQLASQFYHKEYGLDAVCACPTTLYGPGDSYHPIRTKVVGGMVKRFVEAKWTKQESVLCWGSGAPMREFLYVKDAALLLVTTLERYENSLVPLNLGTGQEYSVKEVAEMVATAVEYNGRILWDTSKPDGQYRKRLDLTRMNNVIPNFMPTPMQIGLQKAIADYEENWLCA